MVSRTCDAEVLGCAPAGLRAPEVLSESAKTWVDSKRRDLTELMWSSAGIVRRRADMKAALQQLATLHHDVQVSTCCQHTALLLLVLCRVLFPVVQCMASKVPPIALVCSGCLVGSSIHERHLDVLSLNGQTTGRRRDKTGVSAFSCVSDRVTRREVWIEALCCWKRR